MSDEDQTYDPVLKPHETPGPKGNQGNRGPQGVPGIPGSAIIIGRNTVSQILMGVSVFLLVISIVLSQIFSWGEVNAVRSRLSEVLQDQRDEQREEDCLTFYRNDVSSTLGQAIAANNDLWVSVSQRGPALTEEQLIENAEDNKRLGRVLQERNAPLIAAVEALEEYSALDPPPFICPHPMAVEQREAAAEN